VIWLLETARAEYKETLAAVKWVAPNYKARNLYNSHLTGGIGTRCLYNTLIIRCFFLLATVTFLGKKMRNMCKLFEHKLLPLSLRQHSTQTNGLLNSPLHDHKANYWAGINRMWTQVLQKPSRHATSAVSFLNLPLYQRALLIFGDISFYCIFPSKE
jgi:hypothetical protein